jgi:menaquinone-9 beta-reductase
MGKNAAQSIDVIIIGTGPAGLSTALHLLQKDPGWSKRMLLLEKTAHPRPKLCGGGVTRLGLKTLKNLGLPFPLPIPQVPVEDIRMVYRSRTIHVRGRPQFTVFHRAELDAYLAAQLTQRGGIIRQNEPVQTIQMEGNRMLVTTSEGQYSTNVVVGADGATGITVRMLKSRQNYSRPARTLEHIAPAPETAAVFDDHCAIFDFFEPNSNLQGYLWEFPGLRNGQAIFNRGIYDTGLVQRAAHPDLPQLLNDYLCSKGNQALDVPLQGYPIRLYHPLQPLSVPGMLLVGDAAGVDSLFGEGIAPALAYGKVAAETITDAFRRNDFSLKGYNSRLIRSEVGRYLAIRWLAAHGIFSFSNKPAILHALWTLFGMLAIVWPEPPPLY